MVVALVFALGLVAAVLVSDRAARTALSTAVLFLLLGFGVGESGLGLLRVDPRQPLVAHVAELAIFSTLFADGLRLDLGKLAATWRLPGRALLLGLPLTCAGAALLGRGLLGLTWQDAAVLGAVLSPTDPVFAAALVRHKELSPDLRELLNVESGLNDGLATPVVVFALAVAAEQLGVGDHGAHSDGSALLELALGVGIGIFVGWFSATLIGIGVRRGWIQTGGRRLAALAGALGSFTLAVALDGNGFVAAFVAGIAFGAASDDSLVDVEAATELPELLGEVLALGIWFLFGAVLVPASFEHADPAVVLYAVLSLTVVRMLPVALALLGAGMDTRTVLFLGWFGPRGLASVVFALLAVEELGENGVAAPAISAITLTVLLSVVLHGTSAGPLVVRYAHGESTKDADASSPRSRRAAHA